jgi:hypothetical protein
MYSTYKCYIFSFSAINKQFYRPESEATETFSLLPFQLKIWIVIQVPIPLSYKKNFSKESQSTENFFLP